MKQAGNSIDKKTYLLLPDLRTLTHYVVKEARLKQQRSQPDK